MKMIIEGVPMLKHLANELLIMKDSATSLIKNILEESR